MLTEEKKKDTGKKYVRTESSFSRPFLLHPPGSSKFPSQSIGRSCDFHSFWNIRLGRPVLMQRKNWIESNGEPVSCWIREMAWSEASYSILQPQRDTLNCRQQRPAQTEPYAQWNVVFLSSNKFHLFAWFVIATILKGVDAAEFVRPAMPFGHDGSCVAN